MSKKQYGGSDVEGTANSGWKGRWTRQKRDEAQNGLSRRLFLSSGCPADKCRDYLEARERSGRKKPKDRFEEARASFSTTEGSVID